VNREEERSRKKYSKNKLSRITLIDREKGVLSQTSVKGSRPGKNREYILNDTKDAAEPFGNSD